MKRIIAIFIIGMFAQLSSAQEPSSLTSGNKVKYGLKIGLSISDIKFSPEPDYPVKSRTTLMAGGFLRVPIADQLIFSPEILFVGKGNREDFGNYYFTNSMFYLDIPLNFLFSIKNDTGRFLIGAGPAPAIFLERSNYDNEGVKRFDFGINLETAYEWDVGFSINLKYTHGMTNIYEKEFAPSVKHRYFGLTAGYFF